MTLFEISSILNSLNAEVAILRATEGYFDESERWGCNITILSTNAELKVRHRAATFEEALSGAYAKLSPLLATPALSSALNRPLLT